MNRSYNELLADGVRNTLTAMRREALLTTWESEYDRLLAEAGVHRNGIGLSDGRVVPETSVHLRRLFAIHPDKNTFCRREEDGTISYCPPTESQRMYFRPSAKETS